MAKEEILTLKELRQCVFENRNNKITLDGIKDYFKRNQDHYDLRATFEVNTMLVGCFRLYHEEIPKIK